MGGLPASAMLGFGVQGSGGRESLGCPKVCGRFMVRDVLLGFSILGYHDYTKGFGNSELASVRSGHVFLVEG